ncbi:MAG: radical SAM protein [Chloroflexi bacterium]|nr:radical SAM protein [Chloroflexota bacterium]
MTFHHENGCESETNMPSHPEIVSWNITKRCNLRCAHCYLDAGISAEGELSTEESYRVIDQMAELSTGMVILTGGEPLLRKDLIDIIRRISERGIMAVMGTNGTLIDDNAALTLKKAGLQGVGISLDSLDMEKHDAFRRVKGCWQKTVAGMRACIRQSLPVIVQTTVTPWNLQEIPAMIDFAQDEGASVFNLYYLVCTGRGETLVDLTPQQYEESLDSLAEAQSLHPSIMVRAKCAPQIARIAHERGLPASGGGCPAGVSYLRIDPEGQVTPCPYLPLVAGNVREAPLKDIWEKASVFRQLRSPSLKGRCGICNYRETCAGCRARAFSLTGDCLGEDPWCLYEPSAILPASSPEVSWTSEAESRLAHVPSFVRKRVKIAIETYARDRGYSVITPDIMAEVRNRMGSSMPQRR